MNLFKLTMLTAMTAVAAGSVARADTVSIKGGIHYEGYLGAVAPGNAYNITLGGANTGGTAVATSGGGSVYHGGRNTGGRLLNAEPFTLNVLRNGSGTETAINALLLDATTLGNNKFFGDNDFNQNGFGTTPAPKAANPFTGAAQAIVYLGGATSFINPATGTALTTAQSLQLGGLYSYLGTLTTAAALGAAQTYRASDATSIRFPTINYQIAATQIAVWDVLGYTIALDGSSNLRPGGANNGVNILNYNGVNLVSQAEAYPSAHPSFAGIVAGTLGNPSLVVSAGAVPEPASWALMIAGFGLVGAAARRRAVTAAA